MLYPFKICVENPLYLLNIVTPNLKLTRKVCLALSYFLLAFNSATFAKEFHLSPSDNLQSVLDNANDGDIINLESGSYLGNFIISKQITLQGPKSASAKPAIIDAQGKGHALVVKNSNITIQHLNIMNWGYDLTDENSGIYANDKVSHLTINNNFLKGDGFGIWLNKIDNAKVFANKVEGNPTLRSADRGNGIQVANVSHSRVYHNETYNVRDGIYVIASKNNTIEGNTMHNLRYGIHYMYSYDNSILNNAAYETRAGYAMMSSRRLIIQGNKTRDSEDYGFLFNYITYSTIKQNHITRVWTKPENKVLGRDGKGLFVYNSGFNTFTDNIIDTAEIGIHLTAGSDGVKIYGNSFINNPTQVKYVSSKKQEWSEEGQGNYWSNYLGWDMNNDNIGDTVFEPNDGIDKLIWQYPEMKMIMDSPAILILRWVQRQFPVLKPPGIKDSHPLMTSPHTQQISDLLASQHAATKE